MEDITAAQPPLEAISLKVPLCDGGHFGPFAEMPSGWTAIVVCGWNSPGPIKPLHVRLAHQLYEKDLRQLLTEWEEVWAIRYDDKLIVANRGSL